MVEGSLSANRLTSLLGKGPSIKDVHILKGKVGETSLKRRFNNIDAQWFWTVDFRFLKELL
jgi:hypothetical protein